MEQIVFDLSLITAFAAPPTLIALWFFGLRRFIRKNSKTAIGAASWGLSMWADWTTAWEIGRARGNVPFCARAFLALHLILITEFIALIVMGS